MAIFKIIFILLTFLSYATSSQLLDTLGYSQDYAHALEKAKKSNRPMMLVISTKTCPWCRKLENQVLKKDEINKNVQENFVGVGIERDDDIYPSHFKPEVVPTILFVDPRSEKVFFESYGYIPKKEIILVLKESTDKFKEIK